MILAFDIGGSRIKAAAWDGALRPLGEVVTPLGDKAAFTEAVAGFVTGKEKGIAISIAGVVDPDSGVGKVANIPAIDGLRLGPEVEAATGLPVRVLNDADCFALAEAEQGAGSPGAGVGGGGGCGGPGSSPVRAAMGGNGGTVRSSAGNTPSNAAAGRSAASTPSARPAGWSGFTASGRRSFWARRRSSRAGWPARRKRERPWRFGASCWRGRWRWW